MQTRFQQKQKQKQKSTTTKDSFTDQKPEQWVDWRSKTQKTIQKIPNTITIQQSMKIPSPVMIGRCKLVYYSYYSDKDGYTYFYATYDSLFFGYKKLNEEQKSSVQPYQNIIIKVKSDIALVQLDECKKNGTYDKKVDWTFRSGI